MQSKYQLFVLDASEAQEPLAVFVSTQPFPALRTGDRFDDHGWDRLKGIGRIATPEAPIAYRVASVRHTVFVEDVSTIMQMWVQVRPLDIGLQSAGGQDAGAGLAGLSEADRNLLAHDWSRLVPELMVSDLEKSRDFYCRILGFETLYSRDGFHVLDKEGSQLMIEQEHGDPVWRTGNLEAPYGRGINFQIEVAEVQPMLDQVVEADWPLRMPLTDNWYRTGEAFESGNREFMIQDPDGYLLRFYQPLGERAVS